MKKKKQNINRIQKSNTDDSKMNSRRNFLKTSWKVLGAIAGIELTGLTIHYLTERNSAHPSDEILDAGLVSDYSLNSVTPFRNGKFYLVRLLDGGFLALSMKCSHLGCSVIWDEKSVELVCPCHSSRFNSMGDVLKAPAPRPLDFYKIEIRNERIVVFLNRKNKRDSFDESQITYV